MHSVSKQDIIRQTIKVLEKYLGLATSTGANQVTVVIDMEGFNLRQYAWRPAGELVISLIQMYEANYPEILKECYIINGKILFCCVIFLVALN